MSSDPAAMTDPRSGGTRLPNRRVSVLQDWVMELPLREQGTLLTAVRGCDLAPKNPLDSPERQLVGAIRHAFMVPADPREVDAEPGCFFWSKIPQFKVSALMHYPDHWVSHVIHAVEVLAYRHPTRAPEWFRVYYAFCRALHVNPESADQFEARLSEDRIVTGEIVS